MKEIKKCEKCGKEFSTYWAQKYCSTKCYVAKRKEDGWFLSPEDRASTNCQSASRSKYCVGAVPKGNE